MASRPKSASWRNRIIGSGEIDPANLLANPLNWRIHPKNQQAALEAVVDEVGWVSGVIVNQRTGFVVDGHLRVALALRHEEKSIPIQFVDLNEDEERLILATLDPIAAMAFTDAEKLREVMQGISEREGDLQELLKRISGAGADVDVEELWKGMPQYDQPNTSGRVIIIHFETQEAVDEFSRLIKQTFTSKTRAIWFPEQKRQSMMGYTS